MADINSDNTVKATNSRITGLNIKHTSTDLKNTNEPQSAIRIAPGNNNQTTILETSQWPVEAASYTILGKVGRGAFATVYKAYFTNSSQIRIPCAIKVINLEHVDTNFVDIRQEVQTMRLSMNENILACHTSFIHHTNLWLVMQLMDKGSSLHCLQTARILYNPMNLEQNKIQAASNPSIKIPTKSIHEINMEQHITYILHKTILGLQYIHENGQIHRDIKGGNILLSASAHVRIADFGVSGWLINAGSQRENTRTFVGTPCWMAPEVMEQIHGYDTKADIWSLGITALELAKGAAPYAKYPPMKVLLLTIQEDPPSLDTYDIDDEEDFGNGTIGLEQKWSKSFRSMINWCLQKDPAKRPNCEELLNHEHFRPLRDEAVRNLYQERIKEEICDLIPNVGDEHERQRQRQQIGNENNEKQVEQSNSSIDVTASLENAPSGTTWVFSEGSHVTASASSKGEDTQDFFEEFERTTQGENFKHPSMNIVEAKKGAEKEEDQKTVEDDHKDDLNAFMDQFENETSGENFRR
jgi:serine/threonine-protein kinase OSR1/STK39